MAIDYATLSAHLDDKNNENLPIVITVPGLSGDSHSNYIIDTINGLKKRGFRVVAFNPVGRGVPLNTPELFDYWDLDKDLH